MKRYLNIFIFSLVFVINTLAQSLGFGIHVASGFPTNGAAQFGGCLSYVQYFNRQKLVFQAGHTREWVKYDGQTKILSVKMYDLDFNFGQRIFSIKRFTLSVNLGCTYGYYSNIQNIDMQTNVVKSSFVKQNGSDIGIRTGLDLTYRLSDRWIFSTTPYFIYKRKPLETGYTHSNPSTINIIESYNARPRILGLQMKIEYLFGMKAIGYYK
jgi:hypothetical protein